MSDSEKSPFTPVNQPIKSHSQVNSCIKIPGFNEKVANGEISTIQVFFERVAQEIYNTRKKNYSWGFRVIEPEFLNYSDHIILTSKLYKEENLADLNSVVFKLFTEFNNIIVSTALHMHIPIRGIIRIGESYRGKVQSRKPALVSRKDPLILSDLLKVFSLGEIFPNGFADGMIPAMEMPYHFGTTLNQSNTEVDDLESVGIFMPAEYQTDNIADVTILSNMMGETTINGQKLYACNWKEWMGKHFECSAETIIAFAEAEARNRASSHTKHWQSLVDYSVDL